MASPIKIRFRKHLPTDPGNYLWRRKENSSIYVQSVVRGCGRLWVGTRWIENVGGEWCGPLVEKARKVVNHQ